MKKLSSLELRSNLLSGTVPSKLFNDIDGLAALDLSENNLSSSSILDDVVHSLTAPELKVVNLGGNQFGGTIPKRLSNLSKLVEFNISHNNFEGNFLDGSSWGVDFAGCPALTNLEVLDVSYCNFAGGMERLLLLENLNGLRTLRLDGNSFTGPLPYELGALNNLSFLSLSNNKFAGTVPDSLGLMTNLEELNFSGNRLAGSLPTNFGDLTALKVLDVSNNRITGVIPAELGSCLNLEELLLDNNNLGGTVPVRLSEIPSLGKSKLPIAGETKATIPVLFL